MAAQEQKQTVKHWSDITAERIIQQRGDKDCYILASGITPSGVVHFGNFREVITVDFVARALRRLGKNVRFIFSWDDYDTFRKVPKNMPKQEELAEYLFQPIVDTPDPFGEQESYARHHQIAFAGQLKKVGVVVTPLYQAAKYRAGDYAEQMIFALKNRAKIRTLLNAHRTTPLDESWYPLSVYCPRFKTDQTQIIDFDGDATITYKHLQHDYQAQLNIRESSAVKLPWRIDWPMRWAYEKVDFEPGGKDHSSQGGSYDTAKEIVKLFNWDAPIYLQYDFVSIKGAGGKMSSSTGNLITVDDVLKIYEPEMLRWIFASYKSNVDFAVSFDLDVIKTYEDYDRQERLAFGAEAGNAKKVAMAKRVFELSQISQMPSEMPFQPSFRHLTNILQIHGGNIAKASEYYSKAIKNARDQRRFDQRAQCALNWLELYAPEDFKFSINRQAPHLDLNEKQRQFFGDLKTLISHQWDSFSVDKDLHNAMYEIMHKFELTPAEIFKPLYQLLINQEKGPKLAEFMRTIGKEKLTHLLREF